MRMEYGNNWQEFGQQFQDHLSFWLFFFSFWFRSLKIVSKHKLKWLNHIIHTLLHSHTPHKPPINYAVIAHFHSPTSIFGREREREANRRKERKRKRGERDTEYCVFRRRTNSKMNHSSLKINLSHFFSSFFFSIWHFLTFSFVFVVCVFFFLSFSLIYFEWRQNCSNSQNTMNLYLWQQAKTTTTNIYFSYFYFLFFSFHSLKTNCNEKEAKHFFLCFSFLSLIFVFLFF